MHGKNGKKKPRKKMMAGGPAKKPAVPMMTYGGAQKFIMKKMGGSNCKKPTALIAALKKKYPEEFMTYGGGTMGKRKMAKPATMKRGGNTARTRKK